MTAPVVDPFAGARAIADAVLYEGYILYPYRASSGKNQVRWQFGVLVPRAFSEADGSERWRMRTECVLRQDSSAVLRVRIRCLQLQRRQVEVRRDSMAGVAFTLAGALEVDGTRYVDWDEAVDRIVDLGPTRLSREGGSHQVAFFFAAGSEVELIHRGDGSIAGRMVRQRRRVEGMARLEFGPAGGDESLVKVGVTVENTSLLAAAETTRETAMGRALLSVHTMLAVDGGKFVSLLDPPEEAIDAVAGCHSDGAFPVLIGDDDVMLASPIILYDHPEVAPESAGAFYDATEIDEILALRVLTLTEEEKSEARGTDSRAAAIIDRCDDMPPELWSRLHGAIRSLQADPPRPPEPGPWWDPSVDASVDPWSDEVVIGGVKVARGSVVRLHPSRRADAQDLFLGGLVATVGGVFRDVDGNTQLAVTLDDDPAATELVWQGRYLFFYPDEVEPLSVQEDLP